MPYDLAGHAVLFSYWKPSTYVAMNDRNYLLFTKNYTASMLEVLLLGGNLVYRISDRVFIASLPVKVQKEQLIQSSIIEFDDLDEIEMETLMTWKQWDQSFLPMYKSNN
ncbi:MAG: hypothetical protein RLN81_16165 [Balneolaceae bacterium]